MKLSAPEPLTKHHQYNLFNCGDVKLNEWLIQRALTNQYNGASKTYVATSQNSVKAYYALSAGALEIQHAPGNVRRNMPNPIPVIILGRLAVDVKYQSRGIGGDMLKDALIKCYQASRIIGARIMLVHAVNEQVACFYENHGFKRSPLSPLTLMIPLADAESLLH